VSILDDSLATLSASTYIGGTTGNYSYWDEPLDIALGPAGVIGVTGRTICSDFPVTLGAYQTIYKGWDGFVSILKRDLTGLVASTYLGATGEDIAYALGFDSKANVWVAGQTFSSSFPVLFADQSTYGGGDGDAFLTGLSPDLQNLKYSSYMGGSSFDGMYALVVDSGDKIVGAGLTYSDNFPFTPGAYQSGDVGGTAFVAGILPATLFVSKTPGCGGKTRCYATIQAALNAAADGDMILVGQGIFNEAPVKNTAGTATISGGWNSTFTVQTPKTTRMGAPRAPQGVVVLQEMVIIP